MGPFTYTGICNLAFMHKGFGFNNFSIVFFFATFQGIIFSMSLQKRRFPDVQVWQFKQWNEGNLFKKSVIKPLTACRSLELRQNLQIL